MITGEFTSERAANLDSFAEGRLECVIKRVAKLEDQVDRLIALLGDVVNLTAMLHERTK